MFRNMKMSKFFFFFFIEILLTFFFIFTLCSKSYDKKGLGKGGARREKKGGLRTFQLTLGLGSKPAYYDSTSKFDIKLANSSTKVMNPTFFGGEGR